MALGGTFTTRLLAIIDANAGGAITEIKKVALEAEALATQTKKLEKITIGATGGANAAREINALEGALGGATSKSGGLAAALGNLSTSGSATGNVLKGLGVNAQNAGGLISTGLAAGAAAGVGALALLGVKGVAAFTDLARSVQQFKDVTQASAEDSSRLVAALDDVGISAEQGAKSFGMLAKNADSKQFAATGIELKKLKDGTTDLIGTFDNILVALDHTHDTVAKTNILQAAFGRSWQELLPLIDKGAEGYEKILKSNEGTAQIMDQKDLDNAKAFRKEMDNLGDSMRKFELEAGKFALPAVEVGVQALTTMFGAIDAIGGKVADLFAWFEKLPMPVRLLVDAFLPVVSVIDLLAKTGKQFIQGFEDDIQRVANLADKALGPFINLPDHIFGAAKATGFFAVSLQDAEAAALKVGDAAGKVDLSVPLDSGTKAANLFKTSLLGIDTAAKSAMGIATTATKEYTDALKTAVAAAQSLPADTKAAADAQRLYHDELNGTGQALIDNEKLQMAAQQETKGLADAERAVTDARKARTDAYKQGAADELAASKAITTAKTAEADASKAIDTAVREHEDAARAVTVATDAETAAQKTYNQVMGQAIPDAKELAAAEKGLADAKLNVTAAARAQSDASDSLNNALEKQTFDQKNLATDAAQAVTAALHGETDARKALSDAESASLIDTKAVAQAQKDVASAQGNVVSAAKAVADADKAIATAEVAAKNAATDYGKAEADLAKVQRGYASDTREAIDATMALSDAQRGQESATLDIADAQDRLKEAQATAASGGVKPDGTVDTSFDQAKANRDVERAQIALAEAQDRLVQSGEKLADQTVKTNETLHGAAAGSDTLTAAQDKLAAASDKNAAAQSSLSDAQMKAGESRTKLSEATAAAATAQAALDAANVVSAQAQIDHDAKVADAQDKVQKAVEAVTKAQQAASDVGRILAKDQRDVDAANEAITTSGVHAAEAADAQTTAEKNLAEIRDGAAPGSDRAVKATQDLAKAHEATVQAQQREADTSDAVTKSRTALVTATEAVTTATTHLADVKDKAHDAEVKADQGVLDALDAQKQKIGEILIAHQTLALQESAAQKTVDGAFAAVSATVKQQIDLIELTGQKVDDQGKAEITMSALREARAAAVLAGQQNIVTALDTEIGYLKNYPDVNPKMGLDTTPAANKFAAWVGDTNATTTPTGLGLNSSPADVRLAAWKTSITNGDPVEHKMTADTGPASARAAEWRQGVEDDKNAATVPVTSETSAAEMVVQQWRDREQKNPLLIEVITTAPSGLASNIFSAYGSKPGTNLTDPQIAANAAKNGGGGSTLAGTVGDAEVDKILATIRARETPGSTHPYTQPNLSGSTASGAYQILDSTWKAWAAQAGVGTQYKRAMDAPAAIQDQVAAKAVRDALASHGGRVSAVPETWYGTLGKPAGYQPPGPGNPLSAGQYDAAWMSTYNKLTGGKQVPVPSGGGGSTTPPKTTAPPKGSTTTPPKAKPTGTSTTIDDQAAAIPDAGYSTDGGSSDWGSLAARGLGDGGTPSDSHTVEDATAGLTDAMDKYRASLTDTMASAKDGTIVPGDIPQATKQISALAKLTDAFGQPTEKAVSVDDEAATLTFAVQKQLAAKFATKSVKETDIDDALALDKYDLMAKLTDEYGVDAVKKMNLDDAFAKAKYSLLQAAGLDFSLPINAPRNLTDDQAKEEHKVLQGLDAIFTAEKVSPMSVASDPAKTGIDQMVDYMNATWTGKTFTAIMAVDSSSVNGDKGAGSGDKIKGGGIAPDEGRSGNTGGSGTYDPKTGAFTVHAIPNAAEGALVGPTNGGMLVNVGEAGSIEAIVSAGNSPARNAGLLAKAGLLDDIVGAAIGGPVGVGGNISFGTAPSLYGGAAGPITFETTINLNGVISDDVIDKLQTMLEDTFQGVVTAQRAGVGGRRV